MKKLLVTLLLVPLALQAVDLKLDCPKPGSWKISREKSVAGDVEEHVFSLVSPTAAEPPRFSVAFDVPQLDAHHRWTTQNERVTMPPNWGSGAQSRLCSQMPLIAFLNDADENRICVAVSEALRTVNFEAGLREEDCRLVWKISFFSEAEAPISSYRVKVRIDRRKIFFGDAIREGTDWIVKAANLQPIKPPPAAFEPLYSAWYSFHQDVFDKDIEAECAEAARLGMKVLIVDDGWQTDDNNRGYRYTGDWQISTRRFPDMAAHVRRVHALGMKYMLWYGVPMMGLAAQNYERFKGKYLWTNDNRWGGYSCLDPRFPEVREYICGLYEKALCEWDLDGLKLDFIDAIGFHGADPAVRENYAGRDIKALPAAVDLLMKTVYQRLKAIKPDVLIEFRQAYIGPAIRQYGNMMRAADCPGDLLANRCRTANLRLTSGETAVHADMLEWNRDESAEVAARFVLSVMFSTIQYSVMLRTYPDSHKRMIAHWLKFSQDHRDTLLHGAFRPHHYEALYPWMEAERAAERIACVYVAGTVVPVSANKRNYVLNGAGTGELILDCDVGARARVFDTFGTEHGTVELKPGLNKVAVPVSGYLALAGHTKTTVDCKALTSEREVRALAEARVREIRETPNRKIPSGTVCHYVAPTGNDARDGRTPQTAWKSLARVNDEPFAPGAYVLFERGGLWRGQIKTRPGVTYTAYGEGPKPRLYGSPEDGANPDKWIETETKGVWAYQMDHRDVGALVFDGGRACTTKIVIRTDKKTGSKYSKWDGTPFNSYADLRGDLHFWHDYYPNGTGKVYLKSVENPGHRFKSIEFNVKLSGFSCGSSRDVTIDNFDVRHVGVHGVSAGGYVEGLTVANCEFAWIGGSIQAEGIFGRDYPTRLGNAVEIYGTCKDYMVTNCYAHEVYDAGVTQQCTLRKVVSGDAGNQTNVRYVDNVFARCNYSIEYWLRIPQQSKGLIDGFLIERNVMLDSGCGFCWQRPDRGVSTHIQAWYTPNGNRAKNYLIRNNVFCGGREALIRCCSGLRNEDGSDSLPRLENNVFFGRKDQPLGSVSQDKLTVIPYDGKAEAFLNGFGSGNRTIFLGEGQ